MAVDDCGFGSRMGCGTERAKAGGRCGLKRKGGFQIHYV